MNSYLWIAFGGALGSVARFACSEWMQARWNTFPWGTLLVNVLGSLAIGALAGMTDGERWSLPLVLRQFWMIGVLGGFTTFSSFSLQTLQLVRSGSLLLAGVNVAASVILCLFAAWLGYALLLAIGKP